MAWLKKNWKWLLGAIGTLGLSVLVQKIIEALRDSKLEGLGEKEGEVISDAHTQETSDIITAGQTNANSIKNAHSTAAAATVAAKEDEEKRTEDLVENPDDIDGVLGDMGITEIK